MMNPKSARLMEIHEEAEKNLNKDYENMGTRTYRDMKTFFDCYLEIVKEVIKGYGDTRYEMISLAVHLVNIGYLFDGEFKFMSIMDYYLEDLLSGISLDDVLFDMRNVTDTSYFE